MHEATVCASLLKMVAEEAKRWNVRQIVSIRLGVGVFTAIEPHALTACFELLSEGTIAEGASLQVERIPAVALCQQCGHRFNLFSVREKCPKCGGLDFDLDGGREFLLTGLEAADPPVADPI